MKPISNKQLTISNLGFTLIELLVVISIIGILATLIMANFMGVRERARDANRKSDINQIQKAMELYKMSQKPVTYPPTATWRTALESGNFMKTVPNDPSCPDGTCSSGAVNYAYTLDASDSLKYKIVACLENSSDGQKDSTKDAACNAASFTRTEP